MTREKFGAGKLVSIHTHEMGIWYHKLFHRASSPVGILRSTIFEVLDWLGPPTAFDWKEVLAGRWIGRLPDAKPFQKSDGIKCTTPDVYRPVKSFAEGPQL